MAAGTSQKSTGETRQNFYCKFWIDDVELIPANISYCVIREWVFEILPRLEMTVVDDGVLTEAFPLNDDSVIHLIIGKDPQDDNPIDVFFDIQDFSVDIIGDNKRQAVSITGLLKTNNVFYPVRNRFFRHKTSVDCLRQIAREAELKFDSSIITNDSMTWLQINLNNYNMIKHLNERAFKPNDAILVYSTLDNFLHVKSLKNSVLNPDTQQARFDIKKYARNNFEEKADNKIIWFNGYDVINISGYLNKLYNSGMRIQYYDKQTNKKITVDENFSSFSDNSLNSKRKNIVNDYVFGMLTENTFKNYPKAIIQNKYYRNLFFKQSLLLNINPISQVTLLDKLQVNIPSMIDPDMNDVYSGAYLVGGISHKIYQGGIYEKTISIHRSGINNSSFAS